LLPNPMPSHCGLSHCSQIQCFSLWFVTLLPNPMPSHCGLSHCSQIPGFSLWFVALLPNPTPLTVVCHTVSKFHAFLCGLSPCSLIPCCLNLACHHASQLHALSLWLVTLLPNVFLFCSLTDADSTHSIQFLHLTFICNNTGKCFVRWKNHKFFCSLFNCRIYAV
jgi:hypothetical protein